MRGRALWLSVVAVVCLVSFVYASPVSMPIGTSSKEGLFSGDEGKEIDISASLLYDFLSKREMEEYGVNVDVGTNIVAGKLTLSWMDKYDLYALLGGMFNTELEGEGSTIALDNCFMWGIGLSAVVYEWENNGIRLFADGNYRSAQNIDLDSVNGVGPPPGFSFEAEWQEWQFALGVSKKFDYFIPYAGVKYSDAEAKLEVMGSSGDIESKDNFGAFVGVSFVPTKGVSIDLQGRFIDEEAFSVAATLKF